MPSTRQGGSPLSSSPCPLHRELLECRTRYTHVVELANSSDRVPGTHGNVGQSSSMEDVNCNLELVIVTETFLRLQIKPRNASTVKDWMTTTKKTTGNVLTIHWTMILTEEDPQVFLGDHLKTEAICHPLAPPPLNSTHCLSQCWRIITAWAVRRLMSWDKKSSLKPLKSCRREVKKKSCKPGGGGTRL